MFPNAVRRRTDSDAAWNEEGWVLMGLEIEIERLFNWIEVWFVYWKGIVKAQRANQRRAMLRRRSWKRSRRIHRLLMEIEDEARKANG